MKRNLMVFSGICAVFLFYLISYSHAAVFYVAQESSAGAGDFDSNILGQIESFTASPASLTVAEFYDWYDDAGGGATGGSYNGHKHGGPDPLSNLSQLFLVDTSEGLSLFVVHDLQWDGSGGDADMQVDLTGGAADFLFYDDTHTEDPDDTYTTVGGTLFSTTNDWGAGYTDGFVIGTIENNWTMFCQFTTGPTNIDGWQAVSSDSSTISFALEEGRRVRLSPIPIPAAFWLLCSGLMGMVAFRNRFRKT